MDDDHFDQIEALVGDAVKEILATRYTVPPRHSRPMKYLARRQVQILPGLWWPALPDGAVDVAACSRTTYFRGNPQQTEYALDDPGIAHQLASMCLRNPGMALRLLTGLRHCAQVARLMQPATYNKPWPEREEVDEDDEGNLARIEAETVLKGFGTVS